MGYPSCVATSESPALLRNGKNTKFGPTSETSANIPVFSSPTLSVTFSNTSLPYTTTTAFEKRPKTAGFTQNIENIEISDIFTEETLQTLSPHIFEHLNDESRVHTSSSTNNNRVSPLPIISRNASSLQPPPVTKYQKSEILDPGFESQSFKGSPAPTCIATSFKSRSASREFKEIRQNVKNLPILVKNHPEITRSPILDRFSWADDAAELPISSLTPEKCPRDLSSLRSSTINPFSSLRRRQQQSWKFRRVINSFPQPNSYHTYQKPYFHSSPSRIPCHPSQPHIPTFLNWDQDPRLLDLSKALKALGWFRR
jgi:hypothetical protein